MSDGARKHAPLGLIAFLLVAGCLIGIAKWLWLDDLREEVLADTEAASVEDMRAPSEDSEVVEQGAVN